MILVFLELTLIFEYIQKENVDFTSSTFPRYRQTPNTLIRVKAHAIGVSIRAFTPVCFFHFGEFRKQDSNGRFSFYMSFVFLFSVHRHHGFVVIHLLFIMFISSYR